MPQLARRPTFLQAARELPSFGATDWMNDVRMVRTAINQLEQGIFDMASQVIDNMTRDDRIMGVVSTRCNALPAMPLVMEPRGDGRKRNVAREAQEGFSQMYPDDVLADLQQWAILNGVGLAENVWTFGESRWTPTLRIWHPRYLSYRWDTDKFYLTTTEGQREITPGDGQWVLYTPYGRQRCWMKGRVRNLFGLWLLRQWGMRDWGSASEVWGSPLRKAKTPIGVEEAEARKFIMDILAIGSESAIRIPTTADGNQFDVELLEAQMDFSGGFQRLLDWASVSIAVCLLGQNLTTEVQGGAYAAAQVHQMIRNDLLRFDAQALAKCLHEQSLQWWARFNFGNENLAPMPKWNTDPPEDKKAKGEAMSATGQGLQALQDAGAQVDVDKVCEEFDIPTIGAAKPPEADEPGEDEDVPTSKDTDRSPSDAPALTSARDEPRQAEVEGQLYIDELVEQSAKEGKRALAPDLETLLSIIRRATSYPELRKALLAAYPDMTRELLAENLRKSIVLAELAGRHAILEDLG